MKCEECNPIQKAIDKNNKAIEDYCWSREDKPRFVKNWQEFEKAKNIELMPKLSKNGRGVMLAEKIGLWSKRV